MKNYLLANIGNRNLLYDNKIIDKKYLDKKKTNFFEETKYIFENIEEFKNSLKINIIDKIFLEYNIDKIYLFTTNQKPKTHKYDTYYEAKIIKYLLIDKFDIEIIEKNDDPRIRDQAFKFFEVFFEINNNILRNNKLIISGSGGVPAMKEALNFYSIIKYSNSIILDVDEVNNNILKSTVDLEYLKNFDKKIFIEMIESYNYSAAYLFIKNSKINNVEIYNYTSYLLNRYNFNFEKSNNNLKDIKSKVINEFNIINLENEKILDNRINYLETMIFELFDNIEITFEKGDYVFFLGKIFSLQENIIKYLFEKEYKINTDFDLDKLKDIGIKIYETRQKNYADVFSLLNKVKILETTEVKEFNRFNKNLKFLKLLRNKSIIAHSFGGGDKKDVECIYDEVKNFKKNIFGIEKNIFHELNSELLSKL